MKLGKIISIIRQQKNIPVNYLINNCISRSGYTRFVDGKRNISLNKFVKLIKKLNINGYELKYITCHYNNLINDIQSNCQLAILKNNANYLNKNKRQIYPLFKKNPKYNKFYYLYCVINLIIEQIHHKNLQFKYKMPIKKYLLSRPIWTYFELLLFNDSFFAFNINTTWIFAKRVLEDLKKYQFFDNNENLCARLLINLIIIYTFNKKLNNAVILIKKLDKIKLQENMILEKLLTKYLDGILMIIHHQKEGYKYINRVLKCFKITNPNSYYLGYKRYFNKIKKLYNLNK